MGTFAMLRCSGVDQPDADSGWFTQSAPAVAPQPTSYGNLPLAISQSGSSQNPEPSKQSKFEENGKKFGKKMGNAGMSNIYQLPFRTGLTYFLAIFGAGATIGSKIVDGIF